MNKFTKSDKGEQYITFGGVKYAFIVLNKKIGIRRLDAKAPEEKVIDKLTQYLMAEGFAEHLLNPLNKEDEELS